MLLLLCLMTRNITETLLEHELWSPNVQGYFLPFTSKATLFHRYIFIRYSSKNSALLLYILSDSESGLVHRCCLSVCLLQKCKKTQFSQKLSSLELWCLLTTYSKSYMGFSKNRIHKIQDGWDLPSCKPVLILIISPQSSCHSVPVYEILSKSDHPEQKKWRHVDFRDGGCQPSWILGVW